MEFKDKLNFLMKITQVSNKELSKAIAVDPSLVSLLRSGKRKPPQNNIHIINMANFFVKKLTNQYQMTALAEAMNISAVKKDLPKELLAKHITSWLQSKDDIISQIVESINNPITIEEDNSNDEIIPENSSLFFFEDQGRKEAINLLSNIINRIDEKSTLLIITESELEWLLEDYQFSKNIQQRIFKTLSRGFQIHQILPSLTNINRLIESLRFWMPIYASGQSMVYYYPRIRDNLVKRSIIVVPNHAALVTTNISSINRNYATLLTTDLKLVDTYARQYEDYLSLCRPAFQFEKQIYRFMDYFEEIYNNNCDVIQFTNCISINSFTYELAEIVCKKGLDKYNINAEYFKKMINETNKHLNKNRLIDLFYLPTCQEVIDGKAMILSSLMPEDVDLRYDLTTYIMHLKSMLNMLKKYDNYYISILPKSMQTNYNMFINDNGIANLISNNHDPILIKIIKNGLFEACREELLKIADQYKYNGFAKTRNILYIQEQIDRAEKALNHHKQKSAE